jgi:hypothetical protein
MLKRYQLNSAPIGDFVGPAKFRVPNLRRSILSRLELLFGWVHMELGERALDCLLVEEPSGAAEIEAFLQCHGERCRTGRKAASGSCSLS